MIAGRKVGHDDVSAAFGLTDRACPDGVERATIRSGRAAGALAVLDRHDRIDMRESEWRVRCDDVDPSSPNLVVTVDPKFGKACN